jgi:hypothetical protein
MWNVDWEDEEDLVKYPDLVKLKKLLMVMDPFDVFHHFTFYFSDDYKLHLSIDDGEIRIVGADTPSLMAAIKEFDLKVESTSLDDSIANLKAKLVDLEAQRAAMVF